jgi:hypothetical protein
MVTFAVAPLLDVTRYGVPTCARLVGGSGLLFGVPVCGAPLEHPPVTARITVNAASRIHGRCFRFSFDAGSIGGGVRAGSGW